MKGARCTWILSVPLHHYERYIHKIIEVGGGGAGYEIAGVCRQTYIVRGRHNTGELLYLELSCRAVSERTYVFVNILYVCYDTCETPCDTLKCYTTWKTYKLSKWVRVFCVATYWLWLAPYHNVIKFMYKLQVK